MPRKRKKDKPMSHNHKQSTFATTATWGEVCRHVPTHVVTVDGVKIYGASKHSITAKNLPLNVIMLALCDFRVTKAIDAPEEFSSLLAAELPCPPVIRLDWNDGGTPPVQDTFWPLLHAALKQQKKDLLVFCLGGHGRTGTAISSYIIANGPEIATRSVGIVRKVYCNQCVETQSQVEYLYLLASKNGMDDSQFDPMYGSYASRFSTSSGKGWNKDGWKKPDTKLDGIPLTPPGTWKANGVPTPEEIIEWDDIEETALADPFYAPGEYTFIAGDK